MPIRSRKKPESQIKAARERIGTLLEQAEKAFSNDSALSHRYAQLTRKICMRYNIRLTKQQKMRICTECHHFLVYGANATTRTSSARQSLLITCKDCGNVMRYSYSKEKKASKASQKGI